jgi:acetyl-CoA C-acetyltransferase/acetyl-CoA acyltransferase
VTSTTDIAVVAGYRTPFVRSGTVFRDLSAVHLGQAVTTELLQRSGCDPQLVDEVIFGNIGQPAEATNIARVIALRSGIPAERPAYTVQRNCASGMQAITSAAEKILSGQSRVVIAGGTESMSQIPVQYPLAVNEWFGQWLRARTFAQRLRTLARFRLGLLKPRFALEVGLSDAYAGINMGKTAEVLAREFGIRRDEQDAFAYDSHRRAVAARDKLREEIAPLPTGDLRKRIEDDIGPREEISLERLARMRPYFERRWGTVTIGNSCPITDGAGAVLLMHRDRARDLGLEPMGYLRSWAYAGLEPQRMGLGPAYATPEALQRARVRMADIDLVELNEAFAAQVLANLRVFERGVNGTARQKLAPIGPIDRERLNVNGGAIALGHPVGASGTRLVITLLREMQRRDRSLGLATLCIGGGQGAALVFERN